MTSAPDERLSLRPDCGSCAALCCVALPFARSADFAVDKPAGMPCVHLGGDDRCTIHARLRPSGYTGCTVFDCLGAGQQVTQVTFGGASWRDGPAVARPMFATFEVMRVLHELRWYLAEAELRLGGGGDADLTDLTDLTDRVRTLRRTVVQQAGADAAEVAATDVDGLRGQVGPLLDEVSAAVRAPHAGADLRRQDLVGQDLRGRDLVGASLRGALLIGADLRGLDLTHTDLLGADLRAADVRGADLREALFLLPAQVAAARCDASTRVPAVVTAGGTAAG